MESAYKPVQKVTSMLRNSIGMIYAMYAITYWTNLLVFRVLPRKSVEIVSNKYTISFSNTPGPIKPFVYYNSKGEKIRTV